MRPRSGENQGQIRGGLGEDQGKINQNNVKEQANDQSLFRSSIRKLAETKRWCRTAINWGGRRKEEMNRKTDPKTDRDIQIDRPTFAASASNISASGFKAASFSFIHSSNSLHVQLNLYRRQASSNPFRLQGIDNSN